MGYMTDGLTFNVLRQANTKRLPHFRNSKGELSHSKEDGSDWAPAQWLQAVIGELGEYANMRKKFERGDISSLTFKEEAEKELADVVIYLDILAKQLNIDLGRAILDKFNYISARVGSPIQINDDGSDYHIRSDINTGVPYLEYWLHQKAKEVDELARQLSNTD